MEFAGRAVFPEGHVRCERAAKGPAALVSLKSARRSLDQKRSETEVRVPWSLSLIAGIMAMSAKPVAAMVLVASFEIYAAGLWGGGDAKLLGAAALWFGWPTLAQFAIYTVLAGGTLAGAVVLWNIMHIDQEVRGHTWMTRWTNINAKIPYAVAFAIGGMLAFPGTWWMNLR